MEAKVYNQEGKETGKIELPEKIFGLPWNAALVHQVVTALQANQRLIIAHAKGRGEVRGGGRKPWRQKGTGRARHGSRRSPLWIGGGVTHGPTKDKIYAQKLNKKMKQKALWTVLSRKQREGEIIWLDDLKLAAPKTKEVAALLNNLAKVAEKINYKKGARALFALPALSTETRRVFRNLPAVAISRTSDLNPLSVLRYKYLVIIGKYAA